MFVLTVLPISIWIWTLKKKNSTTIYYSFLIWELISYRFWTSDSFVFDSKFQGLNFLCMTFCIYLSTGPPTLCRMLLVRSVGLSPWEKHRWVRAFPSFPNPTSLVIDASSSLKVGGVRKCVKLKFSVWSMFGLFIWVKC